MGGSGRRGTNYVWLPPLRRLRPQPEPHAGPVREQVGFLDEQPPPRWSTIGLLGHIGDVRRHVDLHGAQLRPTKPAKPATAMAMMKTTSMTMIWAGSRENNAALCDDDHDDDDDDDDDFCTDAAMLLCRSVCSVSEYTSGFARS